MCVCVYNSGLTEPSLFNLFRCQSKHRKQLHHDFDDYFRQDGSGRNRRINLETLEEVPQTLEQFDKSIITGCNSTSGLEYSFVTGESVESILKGRTARRISIPANKAFAGENGT
jgi:hypothetical protein